MAFVTFTFDGIRRGVPGDQALVLTDWLQVESSAEAVALAREIGDHAALEIGDHAARHFIAQGEALDVGLDSERQAVVLAVLDQMDADGQVDSETRSLQTALRGERWPGEPPPPGT